MYELTRGRRKKKYVTVRSDPPPPHPKLNFFWQQKLNKVSCIFGILFNLPIIQMLLKSIFQSIEMYLTNEGAVKGD